MSDRCGRPSWQPALLKDHPYVSPVFDGRLVPDVAALASNYYSVYVGGRYQNAIGGTSAAAPVWSALLARLNEGRRRSGLPRLGKFTPLLYQHPCLQRTFHNITSGQNDPFGGNGYQARSGWGACTGWGTPHGEKLLEELCRLGE